MNKYLTLPLKEEELLDLHSGDFVFLTGTIYTARDAAHKRMYDSLMAGEEIPLELTDNFIYYLGPTPARPGEVIGSAGPTTSSRMDKYTPLLLDKGLKGMIGKGKRSPEVIDSIVKNKAVYLAAIGGAGALLSKCIKEAEVIAYDDLGTEAIRKLRVENLPGIVIIDSQGNNLYETAAEDFKKSLSL
ncbi:MAG: Fe-S-containing hydro-lyase [Eubacterium sp.]|nr:Fe-S-containing hydro-lyase [Eubacterium sp.]MBR1675204.1 Fe-S-containing hydro-lyase [Eubacterium sp.]